MGPRDRTRLGSPVPMLVCRKTLARRAALVAVAGACLFGLAGTAAAIGPPTGLSSSPRHPEPVLVVPCSTWNAPAPDPGIRRDRLRGELRRRTDWHPREPPSRLDLGEGAHTLQVRAIETPTPVDPPPDPAPDPSPVTGPAASITVRVDPHRADDPWGAEPREHRTGPTGWYRRHSGSTGSCAVTPAAPASPPARPRTRSATAACPTRAPNQVRTGTAVNRVGLTASDGLARPSTSTASARAPASRRRRARNARIGAQPTFRWSSGGDATSGPSALRRPCELGGAMEQVVASVAPRESTEPIQPTSHE